MDEQQGTDSGLAKLAASLVAARREMEHPTKDKVNPRFGSGYASLTSVIDAVIPALNKHGIHVVQQLQGNQLVTLIIHESGASIQSAAEVPPVKNSQELGSALTYLRRYTLQALAGVSAEEDDDGNAASPEKTQQNTANDEDW